MAEYTLHCFAQSGNAYKPALMLALSGADWEPRFVDFFHGATRTPEYRALNVMGEVPLLEHRGRTYSQSGVILDYLAETLGKFGPQDNDERREILRWTLFDNHKFTGYTATLRYLRNLCRAPIRRYSPRSAPAPRRRGKCSTHTSPGASGSSAAVPPSPTFLWQATSSGRRKSAWTGTTTRTSATGRRASPACRAGSTLITDARPSASGWGTGEKS